MTSRGYEKRRGEWLTFFNDEGLNTWWDMGGFHQIFGTYWWKIKSQNIVNSHALELQQHLGQVTPAGEKEKSPFLQLQTVKECPDTDVYEYHNIKQSLTLTFLEQ